MRPNFIRIPGANKNTKNLKEVSNCELQFVNNVEMIGQSFIYSYTIVSYTTYSYNILE